LALLKVYGGGAIQRFEIIVNKGEGKLNALGSMMRVMRESLKAAYEYVSYNQKVLGIDIDFKKDLETNTPFTLQVSRIPLHPESLL